MPTMDEVYLGNPLLKKANVKQEFTKDQILEFVACKMILFILLDSM